MISKRDLLQLLDRGTEMDDEVYSVFEGEYFASSKDEIKIEGLSSPFKQLIPKTTWTKKDYLLNYLDLSIEGISNSQLMINIKDQLETLSATEESVNQLFAPMKMGTYANFLVTDTSNFDILLKNFNYWFKEKHPQKQILVRTVVEGTSYIARCFATPSYQPIDNHIVLFVTAWALDRSGMEYKLTNQQLDHSSMKLSFLSKSTTELQDIGLLKFGFTVINSESKESTVVFNPICKVTNKDGTSTTLALDRPISISHRGKSVQPILQKMQEVSNLRKHASRAIETIQLTKNEKINEFLTFKIQSELKKIVGNETFKKYAEKYSEVSSINTFNLLEFFGRLHDIPYKDSDKEIEIQRLFWKTLQTLYKA